MTSPSIVINIYNLKINSIENSSAVNIGQSLLADWTNSDKRNQGFGQSYGDDSEFIGTKSGVDDKDLFDSNSEKKSLIEPEQFYLKEK